MSAQALGADLLGDVEVESLDVVRKVFYSIASDETLLERLSDIFTASTIATHVGVTEQSMLGFTGIWPAVGRLPKPIPKAAAEQHPTVDTTPFDPAARFCIQEQTPDYRNHRRIFLFWQDSTALQDYFPLHSPGNPQRIPYLWERRSGGDIWPR